MRKPITLQLDPRDYATVKAAAKRAGLTSSELVRHRALGQPTEDTPVLACLASLIQLNRKLDAGGHLNPDLRAEIMRVVRSVAKAAHDEVSS